MKTPNSITEALEKIEMLQQQIRILEAKRLKTPHDYDLIDNYSFSIENLREWIRSEQSS